MRNAFINTLNNYNRNELFLLTADLGFSVLEKFRDKWPEQFINIGVAEQNMTGIAAGLAIEGYKVFTYSIANFNTLRCFEQIRNDICYNNLDVTIVSVGGGFAYGSAGYSHHAIQDIAVMGTLPLITLLLPSDPFETEWCVKFALENKGPKYLRIGKNGEKSFYKSLNDVKTLNLLNSFDGSVIALVTTGGMLSVADEVCQSLGKDGIKCDLYSLPIINHSLMKDLKQISDKYEYIFSLEEHIKDSGLSAILKNLFSLEKVKIISFGLDKDICHEVGDQSYLRKIHGIDSYSVSFQIKKILNEKM